MNYSVRTLEFNDIQYIVDYFHNADSDFLSRMGADKSKFPGRENWIDAINTELSKTLTQKKSFYVIWLLDNRPVGHSNINNIEYGKSAEMHLHLWKLDQRKSGLGFKFLQKTIPVYFDKFKLKTLICEPNSNNIAPNKTLRKLGFEFVKIYETQPSAIAYYQSVARYELHSNRLKLDH